MTSGTLYGVATPLGNLGDLTQRSRDLLRSVPVVAAEDTRRTRVLLESVQASPRLVSFHAHSPQTRLNQILDALAAGTDVALVTDAGTPAVSDPGAVLVAAARKAGILVIPLPGPSALVTALSVAGFSADRFTFLGFLPRKGKDRRELIDFIVGSPWTVVLYEAANRLERTLADLVEKCDGTRLAVVARELTKKYEDIQAGTLDSLAVYYGEHPPRGEVTVVIGAATGTTRHPDPDQLNARGRQLLAEGLSGRDAALELAGQMGISRNEAYRVINSL
jgi:16S rRNA (cytidine1402-2'-O)-methyltransferase